MARDEDIGLVKPDSISINRIEEVIAATEAVTQELESMAAELEKIKQGTGLTIGVNLDEVVE